MNSIEKQNYINAFNASQAMTFPEIHKITAIAELSKLPNGTFEYSATSSTGETIHGICTALEMRFKKLFVNLQSKVPTSSDLFIFATLAEELMKERRRPITGDLNKITEWEIFPN